MEAPHHDHLTANQMPILEVGRQIQSQCRDLDQYELVIVLERTLANIIGRTGFVGSRHGSYGPRLAHRLP